MRFVPYHELAGAPSVIVDGSGADGTVLTLSHWPRSGTPWPLKDDLSTQIVFRYLKQPELHVAAEAVSNNHFDEDGLAGVFALLHPEEAFAIRPLLEDVASAGDFGTWRSREAARAVFTLSAFADPERSPLDAASLARPYQDATGFLYIEMITRLPEILGHLERFREFWREEDAMLEEDEKAIGTGRVRIEEVPAIDLAIVRLPEETDGPTDEEHATLDRACHPMAIYNSTRRFRVLLMRGRRYELRYRYETWVQHVSFRPLPRVDLEPLARLLTQKETGGAKWEFDGVAEITPRLAFSGAEESSLAPHRFLQLITGFLEAAPPAWDPFDPE